MGEVLDEALDVRVGGVAPRRVSVAVDATYELSCSSPLLVPEHQQRTDTTEALDDGGARRGRGIGPPSRAVAVATSASTCLGPQADLSASSLAMACLISSVARRVPDAGSPGPVVTRRTSRCRASDRSGAAVDQLRPGPTVDEHG